MAEENNAAPQGAQQDNQPVFTLLRCYLRDASLEMPNAPGIFIQPPQVQPTVDVQFEVHNEEIANSGGVWSVDLRATVTVKAGDSVMFLCECKQNGLFGIRNIPAEVVEHLVNVKSAEIIYAYARANVADLINRTGLPTVHLPEVNFEALYQQRKQQAAAARQAAPAANA